MHDFAGLFAEICRPLCREVEADTPVFCQGETITHIFQLAEGEVRLVRYTPDGTALTLYRAGAGETFAEAALFAERYHCTALADRSGTVLCFSKRELLAGLTAHPELLLELVSLFARQTRELRTLLELRSIVSAPERVMHYLRLRTPATSGICRLPGPLKEVARELGMAPETFYRVLAALEKEGRITRAGRNIGLVADL